MVNSQQQLYDQMKIIEVDCKVITLSGAILSSSLTLHNPHEFLAVMFELFSSNEFLEIEPTQGMVMQGDSKLIKLRCKNSARPFLQQLQKQQNKLILRASYHCEYNRKIMAKNSLTGYNAISKDIQEINFPILFNLTEEIEKIRNSPHNSRSLSNSRKMNSFQKFRQSSIKRVKNEMRDSSIKREKNQAYREDLDFIYRNQEFKKHYESKYTQRSHQEQPEKDPRSKTSPQVFQQYAAFKSQPDLVQKQKQHLKEYEQGIHQISSLSFSNTPIKSIESRYQRKKLQTKNNRGFQLTLLAIIAALFLAFGEGLGTILKA